MQLPLVSKLFMKADFIALLLLSGFILTQVWEKQSRHVPQIVPAGKLLKSNFFQSSLS